MTPDTPLPTVRFSSRVADYVKARPSYPPAVLEVLRQRIGLNVTFLIADVGAGTGISADLFLRNHHWVFVVEPNDAMRTAAQEYLAKYERVTFVAAPAEATTLHDHSVDLIVAAQAYHWFDRPAFAKECRRIGKPNSHLLLMWNERIATGSAFAEAYEKLLLDFATDYTRVDHRALTPAQIAEAFAAPPELIELPNSQSLDFNLLKARLMSSSYVPKEDDPRYGPLMAELQRVFDRTSVDGRVTMEYRTQLHLGPVNVVAE